MKTTLKKRFGKRIRQLRESMGLTQEQLASKVGMDYKYLGSVERGERNITIDNIQRIAEATISTFSFLFGGFEAGRGGDRRQDKRYFGKVRC